MCMLSHPDLVILRLRRKVDLLWLMTEADGRCLSGHYVDGRVAQPGSEESRDEAKIARVVEVGHALLATMMRPAGLVEEYTPAPKA